MPRRGEIRLEEGVDLDDQGAVAQAARDLPLVMGTDPAAPAATLDGPSGGGISSDNVEWIDYVPQETLFWRKRAWDLAGGIGSGSPGVAPVGRGGVRSVEMPGPG